jgi:hypothetical protein
MQEGKRGQRVQLLLHQQTCSQSGNLLLTPPFGIWYSRQPVEVYPLPLGELPDLLWHPIADFQAVPRPFVFVYYQHLALLPPGMAQHSWQLDVW